MNVTGEIRGDKLILEIDCSEAARSNATDSKSGKTKLLASTHGFARYGADISVSLNVTVPKA